MKRENRSTARTRSWIPFLLIAALLAGCGDFAPPNIPRTGNTPTLPALPGFTTGTPGGAETAYPAPTPGGAETAYPVDTAAPTVPPVITATTGSPATAYPAGTETIAPTATTGSPATAYPVDTATVAPVATATNSPTTDSIPLPAQRTTIQFPAGGTSYAVTTTLQPNTAQAYQLQAGSGQRMFISIDGDARMQVYGPNLNAISGVTTAINPVPVALGQTGTYYIALLGSGPVTMSVYIPAPGSSQTIPAPVPAQRPPIRFAAGATSASFTANLNPAVPLGYTLNVRAGQQMTVTTQGNANSGATVTLLAPDRATLVPSAAMPTHQWRFALPQSGDYTMILLGTGALNVTVSIPPLAAGPTITPQNPPGSSTRITFAPGTASTKRTVTLASGQPQAFLLNLRQGQTLYVSTTGSVSVTIYGPDNTVLTSGQTTVPRRWSAPANQSGDYTFVISGSGNSNLEFYVPPR